MDLGRRKNWSGLSLPVFRVEKWNKTLTAKRTICDPEVWLSMQKMYKKSETKIINSGVIPLDSISKILEQIIYRDILCRISVLNYYYCYYFNRIIAVRSKSCEKVFSPLHFSQRETRLRRAWFTYLLAVWVNFSQSDVIRRSSS